MLQSVTIDVFNRVEDPILVFNHALKLIYINNAGEQFAEITLPDLREKAVEEIFPENEQLTLHQLLKEVLSTAVPDMLRFSYTSNGFKHSAEACLSVIAEGVVLRIKESPGIQTISTAEDPLLEQLLLSCPEPLVVVDAHNKLMVCNIAAETLFGYQAKEIVGKPLDLLLSLPFHQKNKLPVLSAGPGAANPSLKLFGIDKSGERFPVEAFVKDADLHGTKASCITIHDVREKVEVISQLAYEKQRLELALDGAGLGAWEMYLKSGQARFDKRWTQMLGYDHLEIEATVERWFSLVHPEDLPKGNELLARYLAGEVENFRFEHRMLTKNGEWKWVVAVGKVVEFDAEGNPLRINGIMQDIEVIKEAETSLLFYKYLIDTIREPFYWLSAENYQFSYVNDAACRHFNLPREKLLTMTIPDWNPTVRLEDCPAIVERIKAGKSIVFETVHVNGQGEQIPVEITSNYFIFDRKEYLAGHIRNISEQKATEAELEQRVAQRTAELYATYKELEAFSYSVSHDLRAPLRSIDGFSKAIMEDYMHLLDEEGKDLFIRIRAATLRMGRLIDDLLNLSRITRTELSLRAVNISALVEESVKILQQQFPERQVKISIQPGLYVRGDAKLLFIALQNLLDNAWKYTSKTADAFIEFGQVVQDKDTVFFVRDNGAGFDMNYANRLFSAFQRLHRSDEYEGTGIGLATVQRIISRHGGKVWAEAETGRGATFFFILQPFTGINE